MALILADRVQETTNTTGTGTLTLAGAVSGYQSFGTGIGGGNTTYYTIVSGIDWEVGLGTYTLSGTTLSRDTVLSSSAAGAKISVAAGASVFCDYPAGKAILGTTSATASTGTGSVALSNNPVFATNITVNSIPMGAGVANITNNLGLGINALSNASTTGADNVAIGTGTLPVVTTAAQNTAIGSGALPLVTTGSANVGIGYQAGASITSGIGNLIIGASAGSGITTQNNNTAIGGSVLNGAVTQSVGVGNSAGASSSGTTTNSVLYGYSIGSGTLTTLSNSVLMGHAVGNSCPTLDSVVIIGRLAGGGAAVGVGSIGIGYQALASCRKIQTAIGYQASLTANNRGDNCTAIGYQALFTNGGSAIASTTISANNTALGHKALYANTTGAGNTAIGMQAGWGAAGTNANATGSNNIYIGNQCVGTGSANSNEIVIGSAATGNGSNSATIAGVLYNTNYTVATLPASTVGARSFVTDGLAPVFGANVTGGGAVPVPVYYDGTNWKVG